MPTCSFYLSQQSPLYQRLQREKNASEVIRQALEAWYDGQGDDRLGAIEERLERIENKLSAGVVVTGGQSGDDEIDASVIDNAMKGW